MSSLSNRNVFQLPLNVQRTPVALHRTEASNASSLFTSQTDNSRPPRFASNAALAHLKALGPRLTSAQRTSIALLQEHESAQGFDENGAVQVDATKAMPSFSNGESALQRRASFKLV